MDLAIILSSDVTKPSAGTDDGGSVDLKPFHLICGSSN